MKKILLRYLSASALILTSLFCFQAGDANTLPEEKIKAAYVYNFLKFTYWPEIQRETFNLCVLGENSVTESLENIAGKTVKGRLIVIQRVSVSNRNILNGKCDAIFATNIDRSTLRQLIEIVGDKSILLISDLPYAFDEMADIQIFTTPNRVAFKINMSQAKKRNILFSSQMLKLAYVVR